jgi:hypothetical protein
VQRPVDEAEGWEDAYFTLQIEGGRHCHALQFQFPFCFGASWCFLVLLGAFWRAFRLHRDIRSWGEVWRRHLNESERRRASGMRLRFLPSFLPSLIFVVPSLFLSFSFALSLFFSFFSRAVPCSRAKCETPLSLISFLLFPLWVLPNNTLAPDMASPCIYRAPVCILPSLSLLTALSFLPFSLPVSHLFCRIFRLPFILSSLVCLCVRSYCSLSLLLPQASLATYRAAFKADPIGPNTRA